MFDRVSGLLRALRAQRGGNATMMIAVGIPALIGASGFAVDMAQWYMWKREVQYAVDQGAIAGAFAMADEDSRDSYRARALQEFNTNMAVMKDHATTPAISLANYNGGSQNSVVVTASVADRLPFSSFLTGRSTTVAAKAQASFRQGARFTSCIIAVDEEEDGAITIGGSVSLAARCGIAALSNSEDAVIINGNPDVDPGWVVSAGGIDDWLGDNTDAEIHEYVDDLVDPFASLTAPNDPRARSYSKQDNCRGATTRTANETITTTVTTSTYRGNKKNSVTLVSSTTGSPTTSSSSRPAKNNEVDSDTTSTSTSDNWTDYGSKANPRYQLVQTTTTNHVVVTITTVSSTPYATIQPGTYADLTLGCDTVMEPGIYVIDGGDFATNAQYSLTGNGVMIVLKNGAGMKINGGSNTNLTAMTSGQLLEVYSDPEITADAANDLDGMLIFEDRASGGNSGNRLNGNAGTVLNGTIYLPNSGIEFTGNVTVTSQCLMIAASTVTLLGNTNMSTFCPPGTLEDTEVTTGQSIVRLVT